MQSDQIAPQFDALNCPLPPGSIGPTATVPFLPHCYFMNAESLVFGNQFTTVYGYCCSFSHHCCQFEIFLSTTVPVVCFLLCSHRGHTVDPTTNAGPGFNSSPCFAVAVASSRGCVASYYKERCVCGLGLFGKWHSWSCFLIFD